MGRVTTGKWRHTATSKESFVKGLGMQLEVFYFNLVWLEKFGRQEQPSHLKLFIVKRGATEN